jgi:hypothetical protein
MHRCRPARFTEVLPLAHGTQVIAAQPECSSTDDMSTLVVDTDKSGRKLTDVVGGQSIAFNRPVGGTVSSFGYSATHPQLGEELLRCVGKAKKQSGVQAIPRAERAKRKAHAPTAIGITTRWTGSGRGRSAALSHERKRRAEGRDSPQKSNT